MVARVTHYRIREGKLAEFTATVGFRVLLVLRAEDPASRDAMAISVWDSALDLRNGDNNTFYYEVIARVLGCCESFSPMHQQEVLVTKFANS
jgi:hypothetical protein